MSHRQRGVLGIIFVASLALSGCTGIPAPQATPTVAASLGSTTATASGSTATWELSEAGSVTRESTTLELKVTRLECANGVTGELLAPVVTYEADRVTVRIDAEPLALEAATCIGNNAVPTTVVLSEPIGERDLVDGGCIGAEVEGTAPCVSAVRASLAP